MDLSLASEEVDRAFKLEKVASSGAATGVPDAGAAGRGTQRGSGVAGGNNSARSGSCGTG